MHGHRKLTLFLDMLQASPQKIDLQGLTADLALQLGDPALLGTALPIAGERPGTVVLELAPPAVQDVLG
jgi:hypothetical protein